MLKSKEERLYNELKDEDLTSYSNIVSDHLDTLTTNDDAKDMVSERIEYLSDIISMKNNDILSAEDINSDIFSYKILKYLELEYLHDLDNSNFSKEEQNRVKYSLNVAF